MGDNRAVPQGSKAVYPGWHQPRCTLGLMALVVILACYLLVRSTRFLSLLGISRAVKSGICSSPLVSAWIIGFFFLVCAAVVCLPRSDALAEKILRSRPLLRSYAACLLFIILAAIGWGKCSFPPWNDELRDVAVANLVVRHSLAIYVDDHEVEAVTKQSDRYFLAWARYFHPPGHYLPALLAPAGDHGFVFYRFFYFPALIAPVVVALVRLRSTDALIMFSLSVVLLCTATFLRNYTFVRTGNELFSFLGISAFLVLSGHMYRHPIEFNLRRWLMAAVCLSMAIFSKFTAVVATMSFLTCVWIGSLVFRDKLLRRLGGVSTALFAIVVLLYFAVFWRSAMLTDHVTVYGNQFLKPLQWMAPATSQDFKSTIDWREDDAVGGSAKDMFAAHVNFFRESRFRFGPMIPLGVLYAIVTLAQRRGPMDRIQLGAALFFFVGLLGIGLVWPRVQYTAPLMLGLVYFVAKSVCDTIPAGATLKLMAIGTFYTVAEIVFFGLEKDAAFGAVDFSSY